MKNFRNKPASSAAFFLYLSIILLSFGCSDSTDSNSGAISGQISAYEITTEGDIYVLAIKADDLAHIRNMETEAYPYKSQYAAGYRKLTGQGAYIIAGLESGKYI